MYKRLTKCGTKFNEHCMNGGICKAPNCFDCDIMWQMFERLGKLEDKITLKQIFELPCKVGQGVYVDRDTWKNQYIVHFTCVGNKVLYYGEIVSFVITKKQFLMKIRVYKSSSRLSYETARYPISSIGKTVFLSKSEAEKKFYGSEEV